MTGFRYALVAVLFSAQSAGCVPPDWRETAWETASQPLIGGALTTGYPAVVALGSSSMSTFCTGTLVSPSVILTAAHCIDMAGNDPSIIAFFGNDVTGEGVRVGIGAKVQHPMWNGKVGQYDVGMLKLNFARDPFLPLKVNDRSPASDHLEAPYRHVGFGVSDRETGAADGKKREGTTIINGFDRDLILSGDDDLSVCFGDSGGPGLLSFDGEEYVTGVHSFTTGEDCLPPNGDTRVDLYAVDFILPWIQENDPVCGQDYVCGPIGCTDDPDCTPCGADGTCAAACALPDPDCPESELGEICQADSQCLSGVCIFWAGDPDYRFCTRECTADPDCPDGMTCQNRPGFGDVCYLEEEPSGVLGDRCQEAVLCGTYLCEQSVCVKRCNVAVGLSCPVDFECETGDGENYYCFPLEPPGEGGCGCRAGGGPGGPATILLFVLAVLLRRGSNMGTRDRCPPLPRGRSSLFLPSLLLASLELTVAADKASNGSARGADAG